jgi:hypothetical protein
MKRFTATKVSAENNLRRETLSKGNISKCVQKCDLLAKGP